MFYADTSALVKLTVVEAESRGLRSWLDERGASLASSDLARTELGRAVRRAAPEAIGAARDVLTRVLLIAATPAVFDEAARLDPVELRSLDALHLAAALALGDELEGLITYDDRLAAAAHRLGVAVLAPT